MTGVWSLPTSTEINGRVYAIHTDFRDILDILCHLDDPDEPVFIRWQIALALFYEDWQTIPASDREGALAFLANFISCGQPDDPRKKPHKLIDWQQDAGIIVADINKVAGCEVRALPYLHWWTFIAYFNAIGEGQLATLLRVRSKLQRGQKLEAWEKNYYRKNKLLVDLTPRYTAEEKAERTRLQEMLG